MVFRLCIYLPDILSGRLSGKNVVHGLEGRSHGMIHIIVPVLSVSSNTVQILHLVQPSRQLIHLPVGAIVGRIRLFHLLLVKIQHIFPVL